MPPYLPIAVDLEARSCVIVGGGAVALRRAGMLLEAGATVTIVAPRVCDELRDLAGGRLTVVLMPYEERMLHGAFLAVAATDEPGVNAAVVADARRAGILVNDAASAENGDFVVPSVIRRGALLLAVTTTGHSPSLTVRIAKQLEALYGPEYAEYVEVLGDARERALAILADPAARRAALARVAADGQILDLIREGRVSEARAKAVSCISSPSD